MKFKTILSLLFVILMLSCSNSDNNIIGEWQVRKINFEFDEKISSPEMIHQLGLQEQDNSLNFKNDSVVYIKMTHLDGDYFYSFDDKGNVCYDVNALMSKPCKLGQFDNGIITVKVTTLIGDMTVIYERK